MLCTALCVFCWLLSISFKPMHSSGHKSLHIMITKSSSIYACCPMTSWDTVAIFVRAKCRSIFFTLSDSVHTVHMAVSHQSRVRARYLHALPPNAVPLQCHCCCRMQETWWKSSQAGCRFCLMPCWLTLHWCTCCSSCSSQQHQHQLLSAAMLPLYFFSTWSSTGSKTCSNPARRFVLNVYCLLLASMHS